jgi:hypothetical protein
VYLIKIPSDLDFLCESSAGPRIEAALGFSLYRNPLVMPFPLGSAEACLPAADDRAARERVWEMDLQRLKTTESALLEAESEHGLHIQDENGMPITPAAAAALVAASSAAAAALHAVSVSGWEPPRRRHPVFRGPDGRPGAHANLAALDAGAFAQFLRWNGVGGPGRDEEFQTSEPGTDGRPAPPWGALGRRALARIEEDGITGAQFMHELDDDDKLDLGLVPSLRERVERLLQRAHASSRALARERRRALRALLTGTAADRGLRVAVLRRRDHGSGADPNGAEPNGAEPNGAEPNGAEPNGAERAARRGRERLSAWLAEKKFARYESAVRDHDIETLDALSALSRSDANDLVEDLKTENAMKRLEARQFLAVWSALSREAKEARDEGGSSDDSDEEAVGEGTILGLSEPSMPPEPARSADPTEGGAAEASAAGGEAAEGEAAEGATDGGAADGGAADGGAADGAPEGGGGEGGSREATIETETVEASRTPARPGYSVLMADGTTLEGLPQVRLRPLTATRRDLDAEALGRETLASFPAGARCLVDSGGTWYAATVLTSGAAPGLTLDPAAALTVRYDVDGATEAVALDDLAARVRPESRGAGAGEDAWDAGEDANAGALEEFGASWAGGEIYYAGARNGDG